MYFLYLGLRISLECKFFDCYNLSMSNLRTYPTLSSSLAARGNLPQASTPTRTSFLIVPRFNMMTLMTMIEPMRIANYLSPSPLYHWEILAFDGATITASNGFSIAAQPPADRNRRGEVIFVLGSWGAEEYVNRDLTSWLRKQAREGAKICSVELGCYLVARAGLLSRHPIATHWSWAPGFQEQFSEVEILDRLFTIEDNFMTVAGGLAGVDLMIKLISDRHGEGLALEVANQMLHHPVRSGDTPQRRTLGQATDLLPSLVRQAIRIIESNVAEPVSVPEIAEKLGLSQRQLERQFKQSVGCTVVQFGLLFRLQHARVLLIATKLSVRDIAAAAGFNTLSHFAHSFGKCFGRRPSDYRQSWPKEDATPSWPGTLSTFLETLHHKADNPRAKTSG
jgi:transcriptional regulator GlxA family with amidase domain